MKRDLHDKLAPKRGISPAVAGTDNTAIVSQIVDKIFVRRTTASALYTL